jgi:hypothetical protein
MTQCLVALIVALSYFVQSAFGFGAGVLAIPFLTLLIDAKDAIAIIMIFSFLCGLLVIKLWRDVDWRAMGRMMPGLVLGLAVGLALFSAIDRRFLGITLALYVLAYVVIDHFKPKSLEVLGSRTPIGVQALLCGFFGGVIQGVMGTGGPMLVTYLKSHTRSVEQFRASVVAVFFIANALRVAAMGSGDMIPPHVLQDCLIALPGFGLAVFLGYRLPGQVEQKTFHAIINLLLLASAVSVLVKEVL